MTVPRFFKFSDNSFSTSGNPWAQDTDTLGALERGPPCPACGKRSILFAGEIRVGLIEKGTRWADVIGVGAGDPSFLLSERVIRTLEKARISGFVPQPVVIERVKSVRLRLIPAPRYFYISVTGLIDVDLKEARLSNLERCEVCYRLTQPFEATGLRHARCYVPLENTWDGSDIFRMRNIPSRHCFCTYKVLELAREHKWVNFRFEPMGTIQRHAVGWKGVDYKARKWPPAQWHPDPPSMGKTLEEWLEVFRVNTDAWAPVFDALQDFEEAAVAPLVQFLYEGTQKQRRDAALVLHHLMCNGVQTPKRIAPLLRKELPSRCIPDVNS